MKIIGSIESLPRKRASRLLDSDITVITVISTKSGAMALSKALHNCKIFKMMLGITNSNGFEFRCIIPRFSQISELKFRLGLRITGTPKNIKNAIPSRLTLTPEPE